MSFGYARVSTKDQNLDRQIDDLKKAGVKEENIFKEKVSGRVTNRPEFSKLLDKMRNGDTLIVTDLDRLGRTSKQLIELLHYFDENGIHFKSLSQGIFDTTSAMGKAIFQIVAILKAMEVEVLSERTKNGLEAARARGKKGGRKSGSHDLVKYHSVIGMYNDGKTWDQIQKINKVSRSTVSRFVKMGKDKGDIE